MLGNFNEQKGIKPLDAETKDMIETVVIDWMNKYPVESGNLAITDPENTDQIKAWVGGVWGRITDEISHSGLPYDNKAIMYFAQKCLYDQLATHPFYEKMKPYLPKNK
jgi:hypothetical protein